VKFFIDMPLSPDLAIWLAGKRHDAVHVSTRGLEQASYIEILEHAQNEHRMVITADLDYPRLLAILKSESPGVILFRGGNFSEQETVGRLSRTLEIISEEDFYNSIIVIEKNRIRRRRLTIESI